MPWSGDGACATCSASSGRTATPYSPISTISWIGACADGDDDDPLLSSSLQMIWRQTACSTIAWRAFVMTASTSTLVKRLAGLECTGSQRPQFHPTLTEVSLMMRIQHRLRLRRHAPAATHSLDRGKCRSSQQLQHHLRLRRHALRNLDHP